MPFLNLIVEASRRPDRFMDGFRAPLVCGLVALVITWLLTPAVRKLAIAKGAVDDPSRDDRRVHKEPVPRWGGLAIFGGIFISVGASLPFAYPAHSFPMYLIGMFIVGAFIVVMGAMDDKYQFSAKVQLVLLLVAGVVIQFFADPAGTVQVQGVATPIFGNATGWFPFGIWAYVLTAIYIFVVTKTMDTIDGIDGLSAGIAAIAAATLMIIAAFEGQPRVAIIAAATAGSSIGFLRHNFNPAKIFMGTGGAQLLGFMLAALSIVGAMKTAAALAILVPLAVFGVPLIDAVQVVIRRRASGVPITQADKRHLHHTLLDKGLSQRQAVWVLYFIAATLCGVLVFMVRRNG